MTMQSVVVTEIHASILRHRILDQLNGRADIIAPETVSPHLSQILRRFLIAGLDDDRTPGSGGCPAPTGARYAKLCFSPFIEDILPDNLDAVPYRLPLTQDDFVSYVERITGIGASDAAYLDRIYRFDPAELFDHCRVMIAECPTAWRLLLSNEFTLARRTWRPLDDNPASSRFRYPLVDMFRILAEFERGSLIMRHLAHARTILSGPDFLEALESPSPLHNRFKPQDMVEVCRWVEYMTYSSAALTEILFGRTREDVDALPSGYPLRALARGELIGAAATFLDHPEVRKALIAIVKKPPLQPVRKAEKNNPDWKAPVERKTGMLRNREIIRWNGLTNEALPLVILDDARAKYPTRFEGHTNKPSVGEYSRPVLACLSGAMRRHADPQLQHHISNTSGNELVGSDRIVKMGLAIALTYLPTKSLPGSAGRFDTAGWRAPMRDASFWRMLLDPRRGGSLHRMSHPARQQIRTALGILRRTYGPFLTGRQWSHEVARVICDMACAISPLTADMHIAFALHTLGRNPEMRRMLRFEQRRQGYGKSKIARKRGKSRKAPKS